MKLELTSLEGLPLDQPKYDHPDGARCVIAIGEVGWTFLEEPNIDDYFSDGLTSFADDGAGFPLMSAADQDDHAPGVYEATTTFRWFAGGYECPDDSEWELGLAVGRCLYLHKQREACEVCEWSGCNRCREKELLSLDGQVYSHGHG